MSMKENHRYFQFSSVKLLSRVWLFATPWTVARKTSLSSTISLSLIKFMWIFISNSLHRENSPHASQAHWTSPQVTDSKRQVCLRNNLPGLLRKWSIFLLMMSSERNPVSNRASFLLLLYKKNGLIHCKRMGSSELISLYYLKWKCFLCLEQRTAACYALWVEQSIPWRWEKMSSYIFLRGVELFLNLMIAEF